VATGAAPCVHDVAFMQTGAAYLGPGVAFARTGPRTNNLHATRAGTTDPATRRGLDDELRTHRHRPVQRLLVPREDGGETLGRGGARSVVDLLGAPSRGTDPGELLGDGGIVEDPGARAGSAENPRLVLVQYEVRDEPRILEAPGERALDVGDADVGVAGRPGSHAWEILRQPVVVEHRRDRGGPRIAEQPANVAQHLLRARHAAAEGAARLDALRLQQDRLRVDPLRGEVRRQHVAHEHVLRLAFDEHQQAAHAGCGRSPR
jgi:hypothetical protein